MPRNTGDDTEPTTDNLLGVSRRNVLKITGVGAGLAALGAVGAGVGQEDGANDNQADSEDGSTGTDGADSIIDDLVDPTFGYPLAADESDAVKLKHVVDVTVEEGQGAHEGFRPSRTRTLPARSSKFPPNSCSTRPGFTSNRVISCTSNAAPGCIQ